MDLQNLIIRIKHLPLYLAGKFKGSGLLPSKPDVRDYQVGSVWGKIFGDAYEPKSQRVLLKTLSVKDQKNINTCGWNSAVAGKEIDEGVVLSVKSLVRYARRNGLLSHDGYSYLRDNQKALQDFGCMEEKDMPDTGHYNWEDYSTGGIDLVKAAKHKIKSYWACNERNDILQTLDEGRAVQVGMMWYSGFNQGGGFRSPWLIDKNVGYQVGGHAVVIIGYDLNYLGKKVYIIQNSYSAQWGDKGKFYVEMGYLDKQLFGWNGFGAYVNLDIENDIAEFISKYDGKDVKSANKPAIYRIQAGKKKVYLHEIDYFVWNVDKTKMEFEIVDQQTLNKIPSGDNMDITKSVYWPILKHLNKPLNITRVLEAIKQNKIN